MIPLVGASSLLKTDKVMLMSSPKNDFTHAVLAEYATATTCPYCVIASSQLYSIYNSGDLDFYYVSLVYDKGNLNVRSRLTELGVSSIPDVYFDGGYRHLLGAQTDEQPYRNAMTQCGERDVPDIEITEVNVQWKGSGTLKITVNVQNNEPEDYNGHLRVYIVEKESRWNDNGGNPYHFGVLDIPIDRALSVVAQGQPMPLGTTYTFQKTWIGALYGFSDLTKDNILVIASLFDGDSNYAVQTAAAAPTVGGSSSQQSSQSQGQSIPQQSQRILVNQQINQIVKLVKLMNR